MAPTEGDNSDSRTMTGIAGDQAVLKRIVARSDSTSGSLIPGLGFNGTLVDPRAADVVIRALASHKRARVFSLERRSPKETWRISDSTTTNKIDSCVANPEVALRATDSCATPVLPCAVFLPRGPRLRQERRRASRTEDAKRAPPNARARNVGDVARTWSTGADASARRAERVDERLHAGQCVAQRLVHVAGRCAEVARLGPRALDLQTSYTNRYWREINTR